MERDSSTTRYACREGARIYGPGRASQGLVACDERGLPGMANHRLSVRRRKAKAQKGLPMDGLFGASHLTPRYARGRPYGRSPPLHGVVTAARDVSLGSRRARRSLVTHRGNWPSPASSIFFLEGTRRDCKPRGRDRARRGQVDVQSRRRASPAHLIESMRWF